MNAVDTNVLIYSLDDDEPVKQAKAKSLLGGFISRSEPTILPWQVAGELLNWLRRAEAAGRMKAADVESDFSDTLALFPLAVPTARTFANYFDLSSRFSLAHWDCMLLAACKEAGATTLYSEDMDSNTDYDGLRVVNPFA